METIKEIAQGWYVSDKLEKAALILVWASIIYGIANLSIFGVILMLPAGIALTRLAQLRHYGDLYERGATQATVHKQPQGEGLGYGPDGDDPPPPPASLGDWRG